MFQGMFPEEAERALADRARHPAPLKPQDANIWQQAGTLASSPFTGAAQAVNETLRVFGRVATARIPRSQDDSQPLFGAIPRDPGSREESRRKNEAMAADIDAFARSGVEYWRADPRTSTWASNLLHEGARVITKAVGYGAAAGVPGMVVGTSIDEGVTGYAELRDRGVDASTAAKVGAVRGAVTAVSMAIPAAGATKLQTAGLVAASGPGTHIAEQYSARSILQRANYPELAAEHDPWDPAGLLLSLAPGSAVGVAVHMGRARTVRSAEPEVKPQTAQAEAIADVPEIRDAAHVAYQTEVIDAHMLAGRGDAEARVSHQRAMEEARAALDEGRPVELGDVRIDEPRARAVLEEVTQRLRAVDESLQTLEREQQLPPSIAEAAPLPPQVPGNAADTLGRVEPRMGDAQAPAPAAPPTPMERAERIATARPDMPVRLDEADAAVPARDTLMVERQAMREATQESRLAHQAAIECIVNFGD